MTACLQWQCPSCAALLSAEGDDELRCASCGLRQQRVDRVWDFVPGFEPAGYSAARREHRSELEQTHFWFAPRLRLLDTRLRALPRRAAASALELGCGSGLFLPTLLQHAQVVVGVEGHRVSLTRAAAEEPAACLIHADVCHVPLAGHQFDLVVALDVLAHVDAVSFLQEARRLTRPRGVLLLAVPAFAFLWSGADVAAGNRCRYTLSMLRSELAATGWQLATHTYYQCLMLPALYLSRVTHRQREPRFERQLPRWLNTVAAAVSAFEVRAFGAHRLPFGSSLIATATRLDG